MYWFVAAVAVFVLEMFTGTLYLLIAGAALAGAGIASFLFHGQTVPILTAAFLSAVGLFWLHRRLQRRTPAARAANDLDIGQSVKILRRLHGAEYEVAYRGTVWHARIEGGEPESGFAVIGGKDGNTLLIHPDQP
ncbi:NfeD-like C-terminal, partner-binding [Kingella potus]|uniref:NfeD-like C-terminal, partner-binding n=2 Tax=Kingella potus TaxID=265175 RepID=A0A377R548_9NEIS|nr:NfeD-like C-terminal, partner-binding [Kingella potus]